jgi:glucose/mannose transport system substrate-binding protein
MPLGDGQARARGDADSAAWDHRVRSLLVVHEPAVLAHLARLGVPSAELDDVAQEALLVAAMKLGEIEPGCEKAFLLATARRLAGNVRRGLRRQGRALERLLDDDVDPRPDVGDLLDRRVARALLEEALEGLPSEERVAMVLVEVQGMRPAAAARHLQLPEGTVASRLRRARERLLTWAARASTPRRSAPRPPSPRSPSGVTGERPELLSWWVTDGEVDALAALVSVYERHHPNTSVVRAAAPRQASARALLRSRMIHGNPPDTFQLNGGRDLAAWVDGHGLRPRMESLDFLYASEGLAGVFPRDVLDMVSCEGRIYAVPLDIHRTNTLYFHCGVFRRAGLTPPSTLDELYETAAALAAQGIAPLALGVKHSWTLTMLAFENLMVSDAGGEYYRDFFTGRRSANDPQLRATFEHLARVLSLANADAASLRWEQAVDRVRTGAAAMTITGDWAKGYLVNKGFEPGIDFGEVPMPGADGAFVFALDVFGLPKGAAHPSGAIDLLKAFGSREGQDVFSPVKGSMPARLDADLSRYDGFVQRRVDQFEAGPRYPSLASLAPSGFLSVLEQALADFAATRRFDVARDAIRAHYDLLRRL